MHGPRTVLVSMMMAAMALSGCAADGEGPGGAPTASFTVDLDADGFTVRVDASNSTGTIQEYLWNFGLGIQREGRTVEVQYPATDLTTHVALVVVDRQGRQGAAVETVALGTGQNPAPEINLTPTNRWVFPGQEVLLDASGSFDPQGNPIIPSWWFGPLPPEPPLEAEYNSGRLGQGDTAQVTFIEPGLYHIQCEVHPWMLGRIIVAAGAPEDNTTLQVARFDYNQGEPLRVPPNAPVSIANGDPVEHTATVRFFAPGTPSGDGMTLALSALEQGTYQATLQLTDTKGARTVQSWGVRASTEAPILEDMSESGERVIQPGEHFHIDFPGAVLFPAIANGILSWDPSPLPGSTMELAIIHAGTEDKVNQEDAECTATQCRLVWELEPGNYEWEVENGEGAIVEWSLDTSYTVYGDPGVGNGFWRP